MANDIAGCSVLMRYQGNSSNRLNVATAAAQLTSENRDIVNSVMNVSNYRSLCSSFQKLDTMQNGTMSISQSSGYNNNTASIVSSNEVAPKDRVQNSLEEAVISYGKKCITDAIEDNFQTISPETVLKKTVNDIIKNSPAKNVVNSIGNAGTMVSSQIVGSVGTAGSMLGEAVISATAKTAFGGVVKSCVATAATAGGAIGTAAVALAPALSVGIALKAGYSILKKITK